MEEENKQEPEESWKEKGGGRREKREEAQRPSPLGQRHFSSSIAASCRMLEGDVKKKEGMSILVPDVLSYCIMWSSSSV